jgi:hypothetical protein
VRYLCLSSSRGIFFGRRSIDPALPKPCDGVKKIPIRRERGANLQACLSSDEMASGSSLQKITHIPVSVFDMKWPNE